MYVPSSLFLLIIELKIYPLASSFHHLQPIYLVLLIAGGQVGLPLVIVTLLFSKKAIRHPTLINFFCTWVIYSVVFCLLCVVFCLRLGLLT